MIWGVKMIESEILTFALNNGVGVLFGVLMYVMANGTIKENTKAIQNLTEYLKTKG